MFALTQLPEKEPGRGKLANVVIGKLTVVLKRADTVSYQ